MRTLIVGAGATGGYIGAKLIAAQRDITLLVHEATQHRLRQHGIQIRTADGPTTSTAVRTLTQPALRDPYNVIIVAVRVAAVASAIDDISAAVGDTTTIVPVVNGMAHLDALLTRYGAAHVAGGAATLAASMLVGGVIEEVRPGATLQIGPLDGSRTQTLAAVAHELNVDGLQTTVNDDIISTMWSKFAFITSTATLTCLLRDVIGPIAQTPGGDSVAQAILAEVSDIAAAEGHPLATPDRTQLHNRLTDTASRFGPSMYRDLVNERPIEADVLIDLSDRARRHALHTPLLDAALVAITLHNQGLTTRP